MTINVAMFGAGRIGKIHAANLASLPGVRLKYVVDVDAHQRRGLAREAARRASADADGALGDASIGRPSCVRAPTRTPSSS
jgi:myo-inositol 2-dehydrogenase / D-chiro-inositol 1-dehydrogenase